MKKRILNAVLFLYAISLIIACNPEKKDSTNTVVDKEKIKTEIQAKEDEFAATYNSGVAKNIGYYADDAISFAQHRAPLVGKQAIVKYLIDDLDAFSKSNKISFHGSPYAQYNPDKLGSTLPQRLLKDYNGQTYWVSANISSLGLQHTRFPKWLNIATGYGAEGMTGAKSNPSEINGVLAPYSERYRQFYIAPDIDLSRIPVKSKTLKLILNTIGFIKIPLPTLEFNKNGVKFHPLYF